MKISNYKSVAPKHFEGDIAKGVAGRVLIGRNEGANNFFMRVFEVAPGGHTPKHAHAWEHEIFIHAGEGEIYGNGKWNHIETGDVIFAPVSEEHQIRNTGKEILIFACLIPSGAPEL